MPKAGCTSGRHSTNRLVAISLNLIALTALVCSGQSAPANRVTAVRFWSTGDSTRVAVEVSAEFKYKTDRLESPPRLFFDIQGSRPGLAQRTIPVGDNRLKQIRIAETQPGVTRIVLDLEQESEVTASQLSNPERLMIEIRPQGAKTSSSTESPAVLQAQSAPVLAAPVMASVVRAPVAAPKTTLPEPKAAARNATGDRSLTRVLGLKLGRVVLDPGHGGHDVGTHGPSGLYEKDLVLDVSQRLAALLEDRLGSEVLLTRTDDTFVSLEGRTKIANDYKADLFLSIHANSSPVKSVTGVETYYLNFSTSRAALDVAARENAAAESSIFDLKDVLEKIALRDKIDESREFASRLQTSLYTLTKAAPGTKNRGVKKAPFVVLIGAQMPSVLAEIGFLTNASDEALMRKTEHRQKIAEALYKGIASYAETLSQFQVAKRD
jgi:N-acetylmuramoyl-L-alanine amidase